MEITGLILRCVPMQELSCIRADLFVDSMCSHIHWDHIGDPSLFPNAEIVMGSDAQRILENRVYPANHDGVMQQLPKFNKKTFIDFKSQNGQFKRISPFGTFEDAVDFFGDGSFFVVDTRVADCDPIMGESYACAMSLLVRPRITLLYFSYGYNEKWSHL